MSSSLSKLPSTPCLQLPPIFLWLVIFTPELSFKHQTQSTSNSSGSYWAFYFLPKYSPLLFSQLAKWHYNLPRHSKQKYRVIHSTPFFLTQADSVYPFIISSLNCDAPLVLLSQVRHSSPIILFPVATPPWPPFFWQRPFSPLPLAIGHTFYALCHIQPGCLHSGTVLKKRNVYECIPELLLNNRTTRGASQLNSASGPY